MSADTMVPSPADPQQFNRFSYVRNSPLGFIDPSGHDLVIVNGAGTDCRSYEGNCAAGDRAQLIAMYKGWSQADADKWAEEWARLKEIGRTGGGWADLDAFEKAAGIKIASYTSDAFSGITDADVESLQKQLEGFKDITLVGYSKGANLVASYISYKHTKGFSSGPDVKKFVLAKAPGKSSICMGCRTPSEPFQYSFWAGTWSVSGFTGDAVYNIYGDVDYLGTQGYLEGAMGNSLSNNGWQGGGSREASSGFSGSGSSQSSCSGPGISCAFGQHAFPSMDAWRAAFTALGISSDHGSGFVP
jgi:hypothetical protein